MDLKEHHGSSLSLLPMRPPGINPPLLLFNINLAVLSNPQGWLDALGVQSMASNLVTLCYHRYHLAIAL